MVYDLGIIKRQRYVPSATSTLVGGTFTATYVNGVAYNTHIFTSSGILTATAAISSLEMLVVAGGGGGGSAGSASQDNRGGGGGAGGLLYSSTLTLTAANSYAVVVGAGGGNATNGGNSSFSLQSLTGATSVAFNGTTDYLSIPRLLDSTVDITIEAWIYLTGSIPANGAYILSQYVLAGVDRTLFIASTNFVMQFGGTSASGTTIIAPNRWYHIAWVRSGNGTNNWSQYVNGIRDAQLTYTGTYQNTPTTIGATTNLASTWFPGYITNIRVVKGTAVYTNNFTPSTIPLTAITNTVLLIAPTTSSTVPVDTAGGNTITIGGSPSINTMSPFNTIYLNSIGGGAGGVGPNAGAAGGSGGGGGAYLSAGNYAGGAGTAGQGNAGGLGGTDNATYRTGGGGGGAGAVGSPGSAGGGGGAGLPYTLAGALTYYAGGGGGGSSGAGGLGGGGAQGTAATTNTGGGGGGAGSATTVGFNGGSGIVIIRYLANPDSVPYDPNFKNNTLLLSNQSTVTNFVSDASTNTALITIAGDTRPYAFNPYNNGYYSMYSVAGITDYIYFPHSAGTDLTSGDFTVECWAYFPSTTAATTPASMINKSGQASVRIGAYTITYITNGWYFTTSNSNGGVTGQTYPFGSGSTATNTWLHFAATRSGTTVSTYLNGAVTSSTTQTTAIVDVGAFFTIANQYDGPSNGFIGYISNVRVVKGLAVYTGAFTPPTAPLSTTQPAGTNISAITTPGLVTLLTCQSNRFIDNSYNTVTNISAAMIAGAPQITPNAPFILPNNGAITRTPNSYSVKLNGSTDYLTVQYSTQHNLAANNFTIEAWIFPLSTATSYSGIINNWTTGGEFSFQMLNTRYLKFNYTNTSSGVSTISYVGTSQIVSLNTWNHVALVRNSATLQFYVNGVSDSTSYNIGTSTIYYYNLVTTDIRIGVGDGATAGTFFNGYISNLRLVNGTSIYSGFNLPTAALTATTATVLLTAQSTTVPVNNSTINTSTVVATGTPKAVDLNPLGYTTSPIRTDLGSGYFNGSTDYLVVPYSTSLLPVSGTNFTAECWVFHTGATAALQHFVGMNNSVIADWYIRNENGLWLCAIGGTSGTIGTVVANIWTHIAMVQQTNTLTAYLNGVLVLNLAISTWTNSLLPVTIGARSGTPDRLFSGYMSNVRIIRGQALYTTNFVVPTLPSTATASTQLLTLQTSVPSNNKSVFDYSPFGNKVTAFVTPAQGTFSPYGNNWSVYFGSTGNYLSGSNSIYNVSAATTAFTFECWVFPMGSGNLFAIGNGGAYGNTFGVGWTTNKFNIFGQNGVNATPVVLATTNTYLGGSWYHVAVAKTTGGVYTLYVNGTADGTTTYNAAALTAGTTFVINGNYDNNGIGNSGGSFQISNLRFMVGTVLYTSNFTIPKQPLNLAAGTSLLACASNRYIDISGVSTTTSLVVGGSPSVSRFTPYANQGYNKAVIGGSMYVGGSDYLLVPDTLVLNFGSSDFTVEVWYYPTTSTPTGNLFSKRSSTAVYAGTSIGMPTSLFPNMLATVNGTSWGINATSSVACTINSWNHLAYTRSGTTWRLFVNGVIGITQTLAGTIPTNASALSVAASAADGSTPISASYISDLRIIYGTALYTTNFNTALPTAPLKATPNTALLLNMTDAAIIDASMINNSITSASTKALATTIKKYNSSLMYFDGASGSTLSVPASPALNLATGDFTIEGWVYFSGTPSGVIIEKDGAYAVAYPQYEIYFGPNLTFVAGQGNQANTAATTYYGVTSLIAARWYHFAVLRTGTTIKMFLNGNLELSTTQGQPMVDGGRPLLFGVTTGNPYTYNTFYLDDFRITKGVARYITAFTPPTAPPKPR